MARTPAQNQHEQAVRDDNAHLLNMRKTLDAQLAAAFQAGPDALERHEVAGRMMEAGQTMAVVLMMMPQLTALAAGVGDVRRIVVETSGRTVELTVRDNPRPTSGEEPQQE